MSSAVSLLALIGVGVVGPLVLIALLRLVGPRPGTDDRPLGPPGIGLHTGMLGLVGALGPVAALLVVALAVAAAGSGVSRGPAVLGVALALLLGAVAAVVARARGPVSR